MLVENNLIEYLFVTILSMNNQSNQVFLKYQILLWSDWMTKQN